MKNNVSNDNEVMRDFLDRGGGAGAVGAFLFMIMGLVEGLVIGFFIWH